MLAEQGSRGCVYFVQVNVCYFVSEKKVIIIIIIIIHATS